MKIHRLIVLLVFLATLSCQNDGDIKNIDAFIKKYLIKRDKEIKIDKISYINYNQKAYNSLPAKQKENAIESFQYFFYLLREVLKDNKFEYKIYTSKNVDQKLLEQYKIIYPYREKIYYAVLISDKTLFCFFILDDNNKIISFCPSSPIYPGKEIEPFLLTSEAQINELFKY